MYSSVFDVLTNIMKALLYSEVDMPSKILIKTLNGQWPFFYRRQVSVWFSFSLSYLVLEIHTYALE